MTQRHLPIIVVASLTAASLVLGCKPDVGAPISLIQGPSILAIQGQPAEAAPGTNVVYQALAVDTSGRIPSAAADVTAPLSWAICEQPKAPVETNSVSAACTDTEGLPGQLGPSPWTFAAAMPQAACQEFGPQPPQVAPGQPPIRPRDPDVTDGYYLPVRVTLQVPDALVRPGMATADAIMAFGLERISCGLANAPAGPVIAFNQSYTLNRNPTIDTLTLQRPDGTSETLIPSDAGAAAAQVPQGQGVALTLSWTADSVETYPVFDPLSRALVSHREAMRVAWYATAGSFEHDATGRTEDETDVFVDNQWTATAPGVVHLWVVLHDSRGGVDFRSYDLEAL